MAHYYEECEGCGQQYPVEIGYEDEILHGMDEQECACGQKCCQECRTLCDGCKTPICDGCSATHWNTGEELCLQCAQPLFGLRKPTTTSLPAVTAA
jgi:hypothetical protein